ncbi:hypothetical protein QQS21_012899 [Conoideocrella luteorostrata]|uniref:Peptidase S8/S53 domain-containing protein n=1 Tax=Conoideocrella luteorostrata TaxID=1105319 RepID=A0AAJ0FS21_9HYPO|nr:hypothetical protein QQS21_012899 [Conoideocrella luteorostrata]
MFPMFFPTLILLAFLSQTLGKNVTGPALTRRQKTETMDLRTSNVLLRKNRPTTLDSIISALGIEPEAKYYHAVLGFTAKLSESQEERLTDFSNWELTESDQQIISPPTTKQQEQLSPAELLPPTPSPPKKRRLSRFIKFKKRKTIKQTNAPWNLARISNRDLHHTDYTYQETAGAGTCVYVLSTGIEVDHPEFRGRAKFLKNFLKSSDGDTDGLGTHVAGIIGSATYGVAKNTILYSVKVHENGVAKASTFIQALDFLVAERRRAPECPKGSVIYMSRTFYRSHVLNRAIGQAAAAGFLIVSAAGNEGVEFPAYSIRAQNTLIVGATDRGDRFSSYSNYGTTVNFLAPGTDIMSTWIGGGTGVLSGTEMASAHVAGIGALLLGEGYKWADVLKAMEKIVTKERVDVKSFPSYKRAAESAGPGESTPREIYKAGKKYFGKTDPPNRLAYNGAK